MNKRIADKVIKKYGFGWLVMYKRYDEGLQRWIETGSGFEIPPRWDNKTVRKLMLIRFSPFIYGTK